MFRANEPNLRNIRQLTFGGENAEAYFSADGRRIIFQSTRPPFDADQMFTMNADGSHVNLVSTGKGRCTCGFFSPDGKKIIYSSTDWKDPKPPPPADRSQGYVWPLHPYRLFMANADGSNREALSDGDAYCAEASFSPDGKKILLTSNRDGDLDLWEIELRTKKWTKLTDQQGYDGGAFYSWDGKKIVYRAYHPRNPTEIEEYKSLLAKNLVRPSQMELWIMDSDGRNRRQITQLGGANFAPFMRPGNRQIIFSSNHTNPRGREFDLFMINVDGSGLSQVTTTPDFDGFPMFSKNGRKLLFSSNRNAKTPGETNVFIADWVDVKR
ncbi:MAG: PD40 domain-containing protein [Armatimonadetes bacterium]|nr:PD40 domain-containing protein [Armatimonadota bacterium]